MAGRTHLSRFYRCISSARALLWPHEEVIAITREGALQKTRAMILRRLSQSEFVQVAIEPIPERKGLGTRISQRFAEIGGVELDIPARSMPRPAPNFSAHSPKE